MSKLKTFLLGAGVGSIIALLTTKHDGKTMQNKLKKYSIEKLDQLNVLAEDVAIEANLQKDNLVTHYHESKENLSQVFSDTKELISSKDEIKKAFINLKDAVSKSSLTSDDTTISDFKKEIEPHIESAKENIEVVQSQANTLKEDLKEIEK